LTTAALRSKTVQVDVDKLVELRTRKNWTQEKLADKAIVSVRTVQNIERGRPTQRSTLARLAEALGVSGRDLMLLAAQAHSTASGSAIPISVSASPYRGLSAFTEADAKFFFGRDRVVTLLVSKLAQNNLLQISGPSGSGKSSLVSAGLIPELRRSGNWATISCKPGPDPFASLSAALIPVLEPTAGDSAAAAQAPALARSLEDGQLPLLLERFTQNAGGALLFIDQFEELFALCHDDGTRSRFLDSLVRAASSKPRRLNSGLKIVCGIRSDWAHRVFSYRGFTDLIQEAEIKIGPLTEEEIRRAIEQPAGLCGVRFEPGLVQRLVVDAGAEPGTLPLLQFALAQLWERQTAGLLTHASYDEICQLSGAIANRAEAVFRVLSATQQEVARGILTSLVHMAEGGDVHTRRRLRLADLYSQDRLNTDEGRHVLQGLIEARLLTSGLQDHHQETVELAHEAVIRRWPRFWQWLQEDGDLLAWRERLQIILERWQNSGREDGFLLRGPHLNEATVWLARRGTHLSVAERQLIQASNARRRQERWNRPVRSLDVLIDASPREVHGGLGPSLQHPDAGTGRLWRLQVQLFAVPAAQERELSLRLPQVPATQVLPLLAAKPSAGLEIDEAGDCLEDAVGARNIGSEASSFLENLQRRGGSGPAAEFLAPPLDTIHDTTQRLKFASMLFDMMHLRGRYEDAATLIEQELAFHTNSDPQLAPLLLSLRIRLLHHQMFYRPVDGLWSATLELLPQCDPGSSSYGEILFMLGGNLGALGGDYREARRFLMRALRHALRHGDEYLLSRCLRKYGDYLRCRGHLPFALAALREARRLAHRRGTRQRIYVTGCLGDLERQRGNFGAARELFEQTLAWAKEGNIPGWVGHAYLGMAELAFAADQMEQAQTLIEQAESHYRNTRPGHLWGEVQVGFLRGRLLREMGREEWRHVLEETRRRASAVGYRRDAALLQQALDLDGSFAHALMFL
jgi:transcriptional regulator with XRE-family HTH domain/tetratricopeptide (TPR) repeat protein